jgi:hypothetical protein
MERKHDEFLPDASRFGEVRRPDKAPLLAIRSPRRHRCGGKASAGVVTGRSALLLNAWLSIPGADRQTLHR